MANAAEASARTRELWQTEADGDDGGGGEWSGEDHGLEEEGAARPTRLAVKTSLVPNAGDGLFLKAPGVVEAGAVLLEEAAVLLKRQDAKRILADPTWKFANPVIQLNSNKFLDIRALLLYKSNHAVSTDRRCNACVTQSGPATVRLVALRPIRAGEELMWEYSPTWYPPGT